MTLHLFRILALSLFMLLTIGCQSKQKIVSKQDKIILSNDINIIIEKHSKKLQSKEIIVSVMNSTTGQLLYVSNPKSATQFEYEAGSVIKPISISLALNNDKVTTNELIDTHSGKLKIGRFTIRDDYKFTKDKISIEDIITYSSNIGTVLIANRLTGKEFYDGYKSFGLSLKTGIDINNEAIGKIHSLNQYQSKNNKLNIFKSTDSYGQGITITHIQLLKAYSVFNNNGIAVTPYFNNNTKKEQSQILKSFVANTIKDILINTVQNGTGKNAIVDGVEIGGKTGTANIVEDGKYVRKYITSFFGFINYGNNKYTIGITVIEPVSTGKNWYYYYASNSAVPVFKDVVKVLIK